MRLVDADVLIDRLNERKSREQGIRNIVDILGVKSFIEEQPTAFDIDKVVEKLEKLADEIQKAFDVMKKSAEVTNEFLMREDVKPLYQKFLIEKQANKIIT